MNPLKQLAGKLNYTLIFDKKKDVRQCSEEDLLCKWARINPALEKLIIEFEMEL